MTTLNHARKTPRNATPSVARHTSSQRAQSDATPKGESLTRPDFETSGWHQQQQPGQIFTSWPAIIIGLAIAAALLCARVSGLLP